MTEARKVSAILVADIVGFSRLAGTDEERTLARLRALRSDLIDPTIAVHGGRLVKRTGDGAVVEFRSVVELSVARWRCRAASQSAMRGCRRRSGSRRASAFISVMWSRRRTATSWATASISPRDFEGICAPGAICLSEDAYRQVKRRLDLAAADLGPTQLKNIADPIRVYSLEVGQPVQAKPGRGPRARKSAPPRLSIVVLPFFNIGGDPEQEHFVDGVTESLTTDLSRIRGAVVIARNTAFAYKGMPLDVKTIGRELNVRYVLEESIQRGGGRMRVNVQLIDATTGNHLWAERFDKPVADIFDMQDEIVARLANALNARLAAAEARRAEQAPNPDSWISIFRAWPGSTGLTPDNISQARSYYHGALAADPDNVEALIGSAVADVVEGIVLFVKDPILALAAAEAKLTKALSKVPDDARGHMMLGFVYALTKRAVGGIAEYEHALALDQNLADAHGFLGNAKTLIHRAEEAEAHILEALRLSPRDTMAYIWMYHAGHAKLHIGSYERAVSWFRRAIEANRNYPLPHFELAAALAQLGRIDEARSCAKAGLALNPDFTIARIRAAWASFSDDPTYVAEHERNFEGMCKAGLPEQ